MRFGERYLPAVVDPASEADPEDAPLVAAAPPMVVRKTEFRVLGKRVLADAEGPGKRQAHQEGAPVWDSTVI